jgi:hypothetical protein
LIEPDPQDWAEWVMYFLDQLEEESKKRIRGFDFNTVRRTLVNELQDQMRGKRLNVFSNGATITSASVPSLGWRLFLG